MAVQETPKAVRDSGALVLLDEWRGTASAAAIGKHPNHRAVASFPVTVPAAALGATRV